MKCSVLMPSRERPDMAEESIKSLGKGDYEVLVYLDDDDKDLLQYKDIAKKYKQVKLFIQPRLTYYRFHEMINFLAEHAKGDWLWLWNDDAFVTEGNPFEHLKSQDSDKVVVLWYRCRPNDHLNLFPAISRKMYETQGFFSMSPHCDSWAMDMGNELGVQHKVPDVWLEHRRDFTSLVDDTKAHTMNAYNVTVPQHNSEEVQAEFRKQVIKLRELL